MKELDNLFKSLIDEPNKTHMISNRTINDINAYMCVGIGWFLDDLEYQI